MNLIVAGLFLVWNLLMITVMGYDKAAARQRGRRVPEMWLVTGALLLGAPGTYAGMLLFRHKTAKPFFRWFIPVLFWLQLVFFVQAAA